MSLLDILIFFATGALIGWIADLIPPKDNLRLWVRILLGVISLFLGILVLDATGIASGFIAELIAGVIIACIVLTIAGLVSTKKPRSIDAGDRVPLEDLSRRSSDSTPHREGDDYM